jgi:hypothetical protein
MPAAPFCAQEPGAQQIFWHDLGGTECVCSRGWSSSRYWRKLWTGYAFNIPHTVGTLQFYVLFGHGWAIALGIFLNEVAEELLLGATGQWGFSRDPPSDVEPRYDSIVRDVACCFAGLGLGVLYARLMRVQPWPGWLRPPWREATLTLRPASLRAINDPRSILCHGKRWAQAVLLWQLTLVYAADGPRVSWVNLMLCVAYGTVVMLCGAMNRWDWPAHVAPARVMTWHAGWAACVCFFFALAVAPPLQELYTVLVGVLVLHLALRTLLALQAAGVWDVAAAVERLFASRNVGWTKHAAADGLTVLTENAAADALTENAAADGLTEHAAADGLTENAAVDLDAAIAALCRLRARRKLRRAPGPAGRAPGRGSGPSLEAGGGPPVASLREALACLAARDPGSGGACGGGGGSGRSHAGGLTLPRTPRPPGAARSRGTRAGARGGVRRWARLAALAAATCVGLRWASRQPLLWDDVVYERHWCGNPAAKGRDHCAADAAWRGFEAGDPPPERQTAV